MKKPFFLLVIVLSLVGLASADWGVSDKGTWPKSWPEELEPLRKQSRSMTGSLADLTVHEIPFDDREEFEAAWPQILKVKTQGAPIILVRSPNSFLGNAMNAGVRVHCPPGKKGEPVPPVKPIAGRANSRATWRYANFIELVVDGKVVDLNTIPLPADTPIIDERFEKKM